VVRPRKTERYTVSCFSNPSGKKAWRVDGYNLDGKRIRENYTDKADAINRKSELERDAIGAGGDAALALKLAPFPHSLKFLSEPLFKFGWRTMPPARKYTVEMGKVVVS